MVLEIAGDPYAAMDEEQHRRRAGDMLRLHDVELHATAILVNRLLGNDDTRQVDWRLCLQSGQHRADLRPGQRPERARILVHFGEKGPHLRIDVGIVGCIGCSVGGLGHGNKRS